MRHRNVRLTMVKLLGGINSYQAGVKGKGKKRKEIVGRRGSGWNFCWGQTMDIRRLDKSYCWNNTVLQYLFLWRHEQTSALSRWGTATLIQEFLASALAGKGARCCPCDAAFLGMKGPRVWRLQNFTIIFQNATEASQCVAEPDALHGTLEWSGCEAVMGKPELQWRPQKYGLFGKKMCSTLSLLLPHPHHKEQQIGLVKEPKQNHPAEWALLGERYLKPWWAVHSLGLEVGEQFIGK